MSYPANDWKINQIVQKSEIFSVHHFFRISPEIVLYYFSRGINIAMTFLRTQNEWTTSILHTERDI